jgi:queuosine precursor transporter
MKISTNHKISILSSIFVSAIIAANLMGAKITTLFGISVSVAIFVFPLTFLVTDAIEEVFGKARAKQLMYSALIAQFIILLFVILAVKLPPATRFEYNEGYVQIFSNSIRIIIASLIAFFISQSHDIWAFGFWRKQTKGKYLWLRNNLSTFVSQFVDTTLFMFIAFYQITPRFDVPFIFSLIIPFWIFKIIFAAVDTPFVYAIVHWLRKDRDPNVEFREVTK